jgi:phospholipase C
MLKIALCGLISLAVILGQAAAKPTITSVTANPASPIKTNNTKLTVVASDPSYPYGPLFYTWSVTLQPSGSTVGFFPNYNKGISVKTAYFSTYTTGTNKYTLKVKVSNPASEYVEKSIDIQVTSTPTYIVVDPPSATVNYKKSKQYTAVQYNQFGVRSATQPTFTWSISPTTNVTISSTGNVTSTASSAGTFTVKATAGSLSGTASFAVADSVKMIADAKAKIKHVIVIMQENRSFDNYFGKYVPKNNQKIDTIPNGQWCVYNNTPYLTGTITSPSTQEADYGHSYSNATAILGDRKMMYLDPYKFLSTSSGVGGFNPDECLGMHTQYEIPAYWQLADNFVLQDRMFEPAPSWSKVSHLYLYSGWSAKKSGTSYVTAIGDGEPPETSYGWNSIVKQLSSYSKSWGVFQGVAWTKGGYLCGGFDFSATGDVYPDFWAALKDFSDAKSGYQYMNVGYFAYLMATQGESGIPSVSWIVPHSPWSEHPGGSPTFGDLVNGHGYVVSIIQRIMNCTSLWNNCAIFLAWDDWGGFYDHVVPPTTSDGYGYGIRVPGLLISPYAKKGFVDRQTLSFDAYLKFIEDLFCNGTRIPKETSGGSRPQQRENEPKLGNLLYDFDFNQTPTSPLNLPCGY